MATSLTNNTLTLNSLNFTGGTAGVIMPVPTTSITTASSGNMSRDWYYQLPSMTVGTSKRVYLTFYNTSDSSRTCNIKMPASGTYLNLQDFRGPNYSGGSTLSLGINEGDWKYSYHRGGVLRLA